jgi:hypothetical protein
MPRPKQVSSDPRNIEHRGTIAILRAWFKEEKEKEEKEKDDAIFWHRYVGKNERNRVERRMD